VLVGRTRDREIAQSGREEDGARERERERDRERWLDGERFRIGEGGETIRASRHCAPLVNSSHARRQTDVGITRILESIKLIISSILLAVL